MKLFAIIFSTTARSSPSTSI